MLKETGYQEKFEMLAIWLPEIIEIVKKDLKSEHFRQDPSFCKRYFLGKNPNQVTSDEMAPAYAREVQSGNVGLGEFIATRWLLKHTDIYNFFEEKLRPLYADFEALEVLEDSIAVPLLEDSIKRFGAKKSYLFSVFNSVVFPKKLYDGLRNQAEDETKKHSEESVKEEEIKSFEALKRKTEREMAALIDKYEKKLSGMQRKYLLDTAALKKQISSLQQKLNERSG